MRRAGLRYMSRVRLASAAGLSRTGYPMRKSAASSRPTDLFARSSCRSRRRRKMAQLDEAPVLSGTAVLVLEDDFLILSELESVLQDAGARVIGPFRRLKEALAIVEQ